MVRYAKTTGRSVLGIAVLAMVVGLALCPGMVWAVGGGGTGSGLGHLKNQSDVWTWVSGCLGEEVPDPGKAQPLGESCDGISIIPGPSQIAFYHEGAVLNCCTDISVVVELDGTTVRFLEREARSTRPGASTRSAATCSAPCPLAESVAAESALVRFKVTF